MMGIAILLLLAIAAFAAVFRFGRLDSAGVQLLVAGLFLASAGYAWQGRPGLAGSPKRARAAQQLPDSPFTQTRQAMLGRFDTADRWLTISEGFQRRGDTRGAAGVIRSALREHPDNAVLWLGYADALVTHARGLITPAAELAFQRSIALAPKHPAPRFFLGLALAQSGRLDEGARIWRDLLDSAPADASWRPMVEQQLQLLEQARAGQP